MGKRRGRTSHSTLPPLAALYDDMPSATRRAAREGPVAVMRGEWVDPDDVRPTASRTPRTINAWRSFCPLRRCMGHAGSSITVEHIAAADMFRALADGACIGFSAARDSGLPISSIRYRPMTGPGALAQQQERCSRRFKKVLALFEPEQLPMLVNILLANMTVRGWTMAQRAAGMKVRADVEMRKLVAILDALVEHFQDDLQRHGVAA
jgi:hypothetical protein